MNNAVKFTEAGGSVGVDVRPDQGEYINITVWDTGVGIPEDQLARIFESFHQVGAGVMTTPREGTGLGLTISRQLARMMGGDVSVESAPGRGSRFTLRLMKPRSEIRPEIRPEVLNCRELTGQALSFRTISVIFGCE